MAQTRDALWAAGYDESVEVNQRALIDKVLARYSGEFTVFRELLQNSDDAQSKRVEIRFQAGGTSSPSALPDLKTALCHQWVFKNDGLPFRKEDWDRLKKIAEGNPDEEKIGAFGVGFYSLFSVTDDPMVKSGAEWMGFYWKDNKDQLFARRGSLPTTAEDAVWTSFEMPLRQPVPMPVAFDFTRFLASSITFMAYLSEVSVYFDDKRLVRLRKESGIPKALGLPKNLQSRSQLGTMNVTGVNSTSFRIRAEIMRWVYSSGTEKPRPQTKLAEKSGGNFFSWLGIGSTPQRVATPLPPVPEVVVDPLTVNETSVSLSIFSAEVDVRLDKDVAGELHRATKKNPPNKIKYELIYTAKDEYDASKKEDDQLPFATGSIFQGLRADIEGAGSTRIFIGHATGQTTGLGGHMASRFIPTVERESIDLMDRHVATWNKELLCVGGYLARLAYERELADVRDLWIGAIQPGSPLEKDAELRTWLQARSLHALKFFTFHQSTPSADVSTLLETSFFSCAPNQDFLLMSTAGVRQASAVRYPDPTFSFLRELPVLPDELMSGADRMVKALQRRGLIKAITFQDVLAELRARPLAEADMTACLNWWIKSYTATPDTSKLFIRTELLNAAVLIVGTPGTVEEKIIQLSSIKTFMNPKSLIPLDGPLPTHLLPIVVSKHLPVASIANAFPWTELSITNWLLHICSPEVRGPARPVEFDLTLSASWAERVLFVLASAWPSLAKQARFDIVSILKDVPFIPTSNGLKVPEESYFVKADLFHDLPVVTLRASGTTVKPSLEKVLLAMGVRKHVDLQIVFNRMIKTKEWSIFDLSRYLVEVKSSLNATEWDSLRMTAAFLKEDSHADKDQRRTQYCANQLYEPVDVFRQLGLPVIDWGQHKWRGSSDQAKLLFDLGLQRYPPLDVLIGLCASPDDKIRPIALKYLLDNMPLRYTVYDPADFYEIPYIPALKDGNPVMGTPKDVFAKQEWSQLGYLVFAQNSDAALRLKIQQHPSTARLVELLEKTPPKNEAEGRKWFTVLAGRISDFSNTELKRLSQAPIVPTRPLSSKGEAEPTLRWLLPTQCFFGTTESAGFHSKIFVFVDFGTAANGFLSACGTKHSPSIEQISLMLLGDPHKFYELAGGPSNFLSELRNLAINHRQISPATLTKMKKASILLGSLRKAAAAGDLDFDENTVEQYDLKRADQVVIADDHNSLQNFGDFLFTAPQEDILEEFYALLGSRKLSSLVREEYKTSAELKDSRIAAEIRALIIERLPLFLHEHTHTRTRVTYNWLKTESHFIVTSFGKLSVTKTLTIGDLRKSKTQETSAVARRIGVGPIHLWLAGNTQVDMYEVATSLNRLLFDSPRTSDALLFMTILSTDLKALKRRGYNVDRILRQQDALRQAAAEEAKFSAQNVQLMSKPPTPRQQDALRQAAAEEAEFSTQNAELMSKPPTPTPTPTPTPPPPLTLQPPLMPTTKTSPPPPSEKAGVALVPSSPEPKTRDSSGVKNSFQQFKRKINTAIHPGDKSSGVAPPVPNTTRPGFAPTASKPSSKTVTPQSHIWSNIDMAIQACRPESGNLLRNREQMQQVQESLNEGYCDISGRVGDLNVVGDIGHIKIYVSQEVPDPHTFVASRHEPIARFVLIMKVLAQVYNLPLTSLHIFYDLDGGLIAFNRNGSIFFNLRYYETWHDADVEAGRTKEAYVSWYFTLAHEIAHNLVQPHNSEHEFYFSAICERHFAAMSERL